MHDANLYTRHQGNLVLTDRILIMAMKVERETRPWIREGLQQELDKLKECLNHLNRLDRAEMLRQQQVARERQVDKKM